MDRPDFLYNRNPESNKGDYGHALLVAGSYGKMGAAVLAARACLHSGVGLLTVHVPRCGVGIMQTAVPEAMLSIDNDEYLFTSLPNHLERYHAIAIGPGIGTDKQTQQGFENLLQQLRKLSCQLVLDADALNILSRNPHILHLAAHSVITPHAKEYERLFGNADPQEMSDLHELVIVKKSHHTHIYSPHCKPIINNTGNPGMATAGSGDVLTGILLGLAAQYVQSKEKEDISLQSLVSLAVHLHGAAGDKAATLRQKYAVIASDIIDAL